MGTMSWNRDTLCGSPGQQGWRVKGAWRESTAEGAQGGVANAVPLTASRRKDCWERPVLPSDSGPDVCAPLPHRTALSTLRSALRAWNLRYLSQGSAHLLLLQPPCKPKIRPNSQDPWTSENADGTALMRSGNNIQPRCTQFSQHLGSGSFWASTSRNPSRLSFHYCWSVTFIAISPGKIN
jgi:hypothetical protein